MLPETRVPTEETPAEMFEERPMVALLRSRRAAEELWSSICQLVAVVSSAHTRRGSVV